MTFHPAQAALEALAGERARASAQSLAQHSPDLERWLLKYGREFKLGTAAQVTGRPDSNCYLEARHLAGDKRRRLLYAEGWACAAGRLPCAHAWAVDWAAGVVDPAWAWTPLEGRYYFGVTFHPAFVERFQAERRTNLSILGWEEMGWPLQSGQVPDAEWWGAIR